MARRRRRRSSRRSFQPAMPPEVRAAMGGETDEDAETPQRRLERWKSRIAHAKQLRAAWEQSYQVETLERYYLGKHTGLDARDPEYQTIWLNHFAATVQTQRPAFLPTKLSFDASPKPGQPPKERIEVKAQSGVLEAIAAQDGHLLKSVRLAMTQAFFRIGVLKACYEPTLEDNPQAGQPMMDVVTYALTGSTDDMPMEPDEIVTDEVFRWRWVNAKNLLLPDAGPDSTVWPWIAEEIEVPLSDAKEDTRFPEDLRAQLRANGVQRMPGVTESAMPEHAESDRAMLRYIECWDIRERRLYVWAEGQAFEGFLLEGPVPDGVEDHPYALLLPVPILAPEPSPWPKPLSYDWLPIQEQYNILRRQAIEAGKRSARKIVYAKDTFPDADEAQKFLASPLDMEAVEINDIGRPPLVLSEAPQSIDVTRNIPYLLADWQRVTGATGTRLGSTAGSDTATEAVLAEQSAGVRDSELRTVVQEWLTEAGRKMLQLVKQNLSLDLWVQIRDMGEKDFTAFLTSPGLRAYIAQRVGPENVEMALEALHAMPGAQEVLRQRFGALKPFKVTRSQLNFEADIQVVPSTVRPIYRAQLLQLMGILGPAALLSPTFIEELLNSFELPQGERIAEEIMMGLQRQAQQAQQAQQLKMGAGNVPGTPQPQNGANPLGTQNPLGAVSGLQGGL